jgi:dynein-related subfamily AAA family protein
MAIARTPGTCARCNGPIATGERYFWSNLQKRRYHVAGSCGNGATTIPDPAQGFAESLRESEPMTPAPSPSVAAMLSIDAAIDARIDTRLAGFEPKSAVDLPTVRKLIAEALTESASITVKVENGPYEPVTVEGAHPQFAKLCYYASKRVNGQRVNVFLYGEAGGGKTTAARMLAQAFSIKRWGYISLSPQAPASRIEGFLDATGTFRDTEFFRCYTEGGVFLFDEVGNMSPALGVALNTALENGHANFPSGMAERHPDFVCIAADNTPLWGGTRTYNARQAVDGAFRDRWVFLHWPIDAAMERRIALGINPNAAPWVAWVQTLRAWAAKEMPQLPVTSRATYRGAEFLKDCATVGLTVEEIADSTVFKGIEGDARKRALAANPLPGVMV